MIHFPKLITRRFTAHLRELSIQDSVAVASVPAGREQHEISVFLARAVESVTGLSLDQWSVEERTLAVAHYLAAVSESGPDFAVGEGVYSDYLDASIEHPAASIIDLGELAGDAWRMRDLNGAHAEAIERLVGEIEGIPNRLHWLLGAMAAQLLRGGDIDEPIDDAALLERMRVFAAFPESDFIVLLSAFREGRNRMRHLFDLEFTESGLAVLPKGGAADSLPPARFPARTALTSIARQLSLKPG